MKISVLVPTYRRPHQLAEALESLAQQDRSFIGEILVGDDSAPSMWAENKAVIAASRVAALVRYLPNDPPLGNYPNQCALGDAARCDYLVILHDDDRLCPGGLDMLARACMAETDPRVQIWFGREDIMDADGQIDPVVSEVNAKQFGKSGPACAKPVWEWCLTQSLPPNSALMRRDTYRASMRGRRDGNAGDWALHVRLANSGAWGRFIGETVSRYRVQASSITGSGRGIDVHCMYELATHLQVPRERAPDKQKIVVAFAEVATTRYLREGERRRAWRCFSADVPWRRRLSPRGLYTLAMFCTPSPVLQALFKRKVVLRGADDNAESDHAPLSA
jgi:hypothetical protein